MFQKKKKKRNNVSAEANLQNCKKWLLGSFVRTSIRPPSVHTKLSYHLTDFLSNLVNDFFENLSRKFKFD